MATACRIAAVAWAHAAASALPASSRAAAVASAGPARAAAVASAGPARAAAAASAGPARGAAVVSAGPARGAASLVLAAFQHRYRGHAQARWVLPALLLLLLPRSVQEAGFCLALLGPAPVLPLGLLLGPLRAAANSKSTLPKLQSPGCCISAEGLGA